MSTEARRAEVRQYLDGLSEAELVEFFHKEQQGRSDAELPFEVAADREHALSSPHHLASEIIDPFYKEYFEHRHAQLLDECLAPWVIGEDVTIEGQTHDPHDFVGLFVGWPRSTFKSSCVRLLLAWAYPYFKLVLGEDLTCMLVHKVRDKAMDHGEGIRNVSKWNKKWQACFPEFAVDPGVRDWDRKEMWRWPNCDEKSLQAQLWSFVAYGETSSKVGGHYKLRLVDDWEDDETVNSPEMIEQAEARLKQFDNLKVRGRKHNPQIIVGTYYHHEGVYKRLERSGGWLSWVVPGHEGPSKQIFDLVGLDPRDAQQKAQIESGIKELERTRSDDLNFPKLLPWRELYMAARGQRTEDDSGLTGGFYHYSCQILLNPVPSGMAAYDHEALEEAWFDDRPDAQEVLLDLRIDPAIGKKRRLSETAMVLGAVDWRGRRMTLQTWLGQEKRPTIILRRAFTWVVKWQKLGYVVSSIGIEATAFQEAMVQSAREGVTVRDAGHDRDQVEILKAPCPVISIHQGADASKTERQISLDGPISRRELLFWRKDPGARKLWTQFKQFPHGKSDGIDAVQMLWRKAKLPPKPMDLQTPESFTPDEILRRLKMTRHTGGRMITANRAKLSSW